MLITFCLLMSDVYRSLVGNILHVMLLVPSIVGMGHRFWKICALLNFNIQQPTVPDVLDVMAFIIIFLGKNL